MGLETDDEYANFYLIQVRPDVFCIRHILINYPPGPRDSETFVIRVDGAPLGVSVDAIAKRLAYIVNPFDPPYVVEWHELTDGGLIFTGPKPGHFNVGMHVTLLHRAQLPAILVHMHSPRNGTLNEHWIPAFSEQNTASTAFSVLIVNIPSGISPTRWDLEQRLKRYVEVWTIKNQVVGFRKLVDPESLPLMVDWSELARADR